MRAAATVRKGSNLPFRGKGGKVRNRRVSPVAPRPGEGPLTEPTAGAQPWPRERVLMPQNRRSRRASGSAESGGQGTFPICPAFEAHASKPVIHHLNRNVHALARSRGDDNVFKNR